jgi:phosphatidylglycerophosphatase A
MPTDFSPLQKSRPAKGLGPRLAWLIVTGGGLGAIPLMPGTFGTLGGVVIAGVIGLCVQPPLWQMVGLAVALVVVCAANVLLGGWCERFFAGKDPQSVVIDEIAGYLLAAIITWPLTFAGNSLFPLTYELAAVFLLFRVFDIVKPFPAQHAERLPKGWGVLMDDLVAGLFAAAALWAVMWLVPLWKGIN